MPHVSGPAPIRLLPSELADQIAAGEVVERPASIVKELLDNAIDAGATRVELELVAGGTARILVIDDGRGIEAEQLPLALVRHATSKLATAADLVEPSWLGFRGEALASIAAVAHVTIESRTAMAAHGTRLRSLAGLPPTAEPCGGVPGTRVEIENLFVNVPARRKFLRSPATEFTHCLDTALRIALVHHDVALRVRHEGRLVFEAPREDGDARIERMLVRRGAQGLRRVAGEFDGVQVRAFVGQGSSERGELTVVVRRRVVRERAIARIVHECFDDPRLVACVWMEPAHGEVDVNVHPQKSEVRFADAQRIYGALRRALASLSQAPLDDRRGDAKAELPPPARPEIGGARSGLPTPVRAEPPAPALFEVEPEPAPPRYALRTMAASPDYGRARDELRAQATALAGLTAVGDAAPRGAAEATPAAMPPARDEPVLLDCLPGPIALVRHGDALLAMDLRRVRAFLLQRRLQAELGGGELSAQALLVPAVVRLPADALASCEHEAARLAALGLVVERFGDEAVIVRAVPATLRAVVDELDVAALLTKVLPYLRAPSGAVGSPTQALAEFAAVEVAPRFVRGFVRELFDAGVALDDVPGVRRWSAAELVEHPRGSR